MILLEKALSIMFLDSEFVDAFTGDIENALEEYETSLAFCTSPGEIRDVISLDCDCFLPSALVIDTYEKFLSFRRDDSDVLRRYAEYIFSAIPDWSDYAQKLINEANNLEANKNTF